MGFFICKIMARPQRNNVDYFPFYCDEGNKMFYLEETYGNDGFATFLKLLRELAKAEFHYLDLSKNTTKMFLSAKCKVSKELLESIINDLVELEKFDKELWENISIIWCQDFIDSIQDAYTKRTNECVDRKGLLKILDSKGVTKPSKNTSKPSKNEQSTPVNPQTILEDIKEEKTKEKKVYSKEIHDSYDRLILYFPEHLRPNDEKKKNTWLDTLDKLTRIDKIPLDIIEPVVIKTRGDSFWAKNFLSLTKLRKKNREDVMYIVVFNEQIKNGTGHKFNEEEVKDRIQRW